MSVFKEIKALFPPPGLQIKPQNLGVREGAYSELPFNRWTCVILIGSWVCLCGMTTLGTAALVLLK